jgi:uncharacterized LabA/DUF88 family protein
MEKVYAYVDGESHYQRSIDSLKTRFGLSSESLDVTRLRAANPNKSPLTLNAKGCLFWVHPYLSFHVKKFDRIVYFTSMVGSGDQVFKLQQQIRDADMEPEVVVETSDLAEQRKYKREQGGMIYKPKGVDIALAVRMLEDAYLDNYQTAVLFTSDVDYLPVIKAVRRMGKVVLVRGYASGLGDRSPLLYVPDSFSDLGKDLTDDVTYESPPEATAQPAE